MDYEVPLGSRWQFGQGGWVKVQSPPGRRPGPKQVVPGGHVLFLRVGRSLGNPDSLVPLEIFLYRHDGGQITASAWSRVKMGAIEKFVNLPDIAEKIEDEFDEPGPLLRTAASFFDDVSWGQAGSPPADDSGPGLMNWVEGMFLSQVSGSAYRPIAQLVDPEPPLTMTVIVPEVDARLPMNLRGTDEFFAEVARVYRELFAIGVHPAPAIADANPDTPITTIHYWFRKSRDLGYLVSRGRGRAG